MHLDVVGFKAAFIARVRIARHIRETGYISPQRNFSGWHAKLEGNTTNGLDPLAALASRVVETGRAHPFLDEPIQINVGGYYLVLHGKPLCLSEQFIVLINQGVTI